MYKLRKNERGGAAIVAVLIVIMIIAIGSAIMVVTGRGAIEPTKKLPANAPLDSSSSTVDESSIVELVEPEPEPEPEPLFVYPEEDVNYEEISIKDLTTKYGIIVDADQNTILAGKNYNKKIYPASLTKVMTLIIAVEYIENSDSEDLDTEFKFTDKILDPLMEENASMAGFEPGETVRFEDLLYAGILPSGADGTAGIAEVVAGSEEAFVQLMNDKAEELGLTGTHFVNASGLHNKEHYSTCGDLAVIMEYALQNSLCKEILTTDKYTTTKTKQHADGIELESIVAARYSAGEYWIEGGGDLLGGKTGFTDESLYSLVSIVEKDGRSFVCVTVKSSGQWESFDDTVAVYEKYLPSTSTDDDDDSEDSSFSDED